MGLTVSYAPSGEQAFKKVPAGVHVARCVSVVDLGTQSIVYMGDTKLQHKISLTWEVLGEDEAGVPMTATMQDGSERPLQISKRYTFSLNEKANMRKDLAAWRGRDFTADELAGFDMAKLLGAYCMINVVHEDAPNGKTYANIASITPLPSALNKNKPKSSTPLIQFDLDAYDAAKFEALPAFLQKAIVESVEYKERARQAKTAPAKTAPAATGTAFDDMEDDPIPF